MKKIFLMALAGVLIVACQTPGERVPDNDGTKKVTIAIKKNATTRAQLNQEINEGVYTELTDGTLYFFAGDNMVMAYPIPTDVLETPRSEFTVEGVPASAETVAMIANQTLTAPATWTAFKATTMNIAAQASMAAGSGTYDGIDDWIYLNAIKGIALMDLCGYEDEANPLEETDEEGLWEATINLVPAVSRIELGKDDAPAISIKGGIDNPNATGLISFDLVGVYVNNYSPTFTLGFEQAAAMLGADIQPNPADTDWAEAYKALDPCQYLFDEDFDAFAYHIFPGEGIPHIIIKADNFVYEDGRQITTPKYWLIDEYYYDDDRETPIVWEPGYVYKIETVVVGDTIPRDDPYDDPVSVSVIVKVEPWHMEYVYVEPK
jgi:hypothetical protein